MIASLPRSVRYGCTPAVVLLSFLTASASAAAAPAADTAGRQAPPVTVVGQRYRNDTVLSTIPAITVARRTDVVVVDAQPGAGALNRSRELFQGVPGLTFWEFNGTGLQANIATRGLSPHRSSEFGVRQNGYDIASDPYGYPEAHYTPPTLALERINIVRGGGGIQYGAQFGGMIDYVVKAPSPKPFDAAVSLSGGSYGMVDAMAFVSGTLEGTVAYRSWLQYRRGDGWRQASNYDVVSGHASAMLVVGPGRLTAELTGLWFEERMPNGLTQRQYDTDPRSGLRPRDWFAGPRLMPALRYEVDLGETTRWSTHVSGLVGNRNSVTLATSTAIADTGTNARRVNIDAFANVIMESRLATTLGRVRLVGGLRAGWTATDRSQGRAEAGTTYTTTMTAEPTIDLALRSTVFAAFAEAQVSLASDVTATLGGRLEHLVGSASGIYGPGQPASSPQAFERSAASTVIDQRSPATVPLVSAGIQWQATEEVALYTSFGQAYRPLFYAQQFPYDGIPVDASIKPSRGYVAEVGTRGSAVRTSAVPQGVLDWNVSAFALSYQDRVGLLFPDSTSYPRGLRTNAGESFHYGVEATVGATAVQTDALTVVVRCTASMMEARYVAGRAKDKDVEFAPAWTASPCLLVTSGPLSCSLVVSATAGVYSDAANTMVDPSGMTGWIPSYTIVDLSARYRVAATTDVGLSVLNLADATYHTVRTTVYPGPGILPGDGRTLVLRLTQGL